MGRESATRFGTILLEMISIVVVVLGFTGRAGARSGETRKRRLRPLRIARGAVIDGDLA